MSLTIYAVSVGQYDDFGYVGFFIKEEDAAEEGGSLDSLREALGKLES